MSQYAVIGTSPFHDVAVAAGPFRAVDRAARAASDMTAKGFNIEVVELQDVWDIPTVRNDEGADV